MGVSDDWPDSRGVLTNKDREFLTASDEKIEEMKDNTVYKKRQRIKERVHAAIWDFGVLFSQMDSNTLHSFYDGPDPRQDDIDDPSRMPLDGFSDHAANAIAFIYLTLPYPSFIKAIETGIYRAERYSQERRMVSVDVDPDCIERTYAPTEENQDKYDVDELRSKLTTGQELTELERIALVNMIEQFDNTNDVVDQEQLFSHRNE